MEYSETVEAHTRMMKCTLEVEPSRSYWKACATNGGPISKEQAFENAVFGSKTYLRIERLMADMRHRYDDFPFALEVLGKWSHMELSDRVLICHWHTQLVDPIYRKFTGEYLVERYFGPSGTVDNDLAYHWIEVEVPGRWQIPTRKKIASKMLTSAQTAGIVSPNRNLKTIKFPRVSDLALTYLMYLLKEISYAGTAINNPYLASVGIDSEEAIRRLRKIQHLGFCRQGELISFEWHYSNMLDWATAIGIVDAPLAEGVSR